MGIWAEGNCESFGSPRRGGPLSTPRSKSPKLIVPKDMTRQTPTATEARAPAENAGVNAPVNGRKKRPRETPDARHPLTDNDKSAHFVGWAAHHYDYVHHFWRDENDQRAPDLSDPRNWVKALENLNSAGWLWFIANHVDGSIQMKIWRPGTISWRPGEIPLSRLPAAIKPIGGIVREALAGIYDAEHPDEKM